MEVFMGLRIYPCGKIERKFKSGMWREVQNTDNSRGYNRVDINGKKWLRDELVMAAFNKHFDIDSNKLKIIHVDDNKLNSAFNNLRAIPPHIDQLNKTKAKGYCWLEKIGMAKAEIHICGEKKFIGYYKTEEEARAAYLRVKEKYLNIETLL
jgi:hypothetical protein